MSYHVRINSPDDAYLMVERGVTQLGYSGTICKLPPAMARGYDERVRHIRGEELGPDADFRVFPDFATQPKRQPVLVVMPYVEDEPVHYPSDRMAAIAAGGETLHVTIDSREGHFDAAEWVAALGDGLRPLVDDFVRHWAEDVGAAWALVEADRRGLEPTPVEVSDVEVGNTETDYGAREGRLLDGAGTLADLLATAKARAQHVLERWPEEADGFGKLEQAVGLMGQCGDELERVEINTSPSGARAE